MPNTSPNPVSAGELAQLQADMASLMDQTIQITRRSVAQGATGNVVPTYGAVATVAGTLSQPTAGQLANYDYLVGSLAAWQVRLPAGTDVRASDRLVVAGQTLEVHVVLTPQSYLGAIRLLAAEVK